VHPLRELSPDGPGIRQARVDCAPIACLLVPAAIFQLLGGFRRRYAPAFFEDADFCLRAANEFGIPTFCALDANAVLSAATGSEIYAPAARVNAVTFAADWGTSVRFGLDAPPAEWSTPFWPPQPPRITALMTVYNGEAYLKEAIDSILAQTLPEFVFLIVDDGSTDTAPAILEKYAGEDARVRIVTNEKNIGIAASLNRGINLIDTPYIAIMDMDDISQPERFELQLAYMESHPEVAAVGCQMMLFHSENPQQGTVLWQMPTSPHIVRQWMYRKAYCLPHPGSMLRTMDIKAVGGYREQFRAAQDYDLWLRLLEKHELCNLPETLLFHRQHDASVSTKCRAQQMMEHVLAMQSFEYRRQGKADPIVGKELTLELLLSLLDPSKPSAYMWVMFLTSDSINDRGRLLYDALALILRHASSTGEMSETMDLLETYLHTEGIACIAQILSDTPKLRDEPGYPAVAGAIASLSQRHAGSASTGV
jgi:GT2 family glycosyltransferase